MANLEAGFLLAERYLLQDRLGDGGHAEVWRARDTRSARIVALKFLHLRNEVAALPVLRHEASMAQRLDHHGVLKLQDPERDGSFVFLPMEFAAGGDASRLRGAHWQRVLPVLLQVARVLEHAHARGVVHRDLKARNVLFDALGDIRVSDFGAAASTGSSDAPAAGSPFSASPQQLRDEPATPADDVYGLGALAYELLTRYPPFYPDFDTRRVQVESPARPVPTHAAPTALLDLIEAMLARDAASRPSLAAVITAFEGHLAASEMAPEDGATLVDESTPYASENTLPLQRRRRRTIMLWMAGLVILCGVAALLWLPQLSSSLTATVTAPPVSKPMRVADAVLPEPAVVATPPAQSAPPPADTALPDALRAGQAALVAMQPDRARAAFQHALALQADVPQARAGLEASAQLEAQLAGLAAGARMEAHGDLSAAADQYRLLLANHADFQPARAALTRVQQQLRQQKLEDLLSVGADALRHGRIAVAQSTYQQAAQIDPDSTRVREGQQRVTQVLTNQRNANDLTKGARLEEAESWDEAVAHYRSVLARDATLGFAQDGLARSERRAVLDHELADYLARPQRLTATTVRQAAERALARGDASAGDAPRLRQQLQQLRARLAALDVAVPVDITSDNLTRVSLAPLGDLGSFSSRAVQLPPGHYTVIGQRDGFRDVRQEFEIAAGQSTAMLSVKCTERI